MEQALYLHPDDIELFKRARLVAYSLASICGADLREVEPKRRPLADGADGLCYVAEHKISIAFRYKHRASEGGCWYKHPIKWLCITQTVAHEIAHLIYPNHSKQFRKLEQYLMGLV